MASIEGMDETDCGRSIMQRAAMAMLVCWASHAWSVAQETSCPTIAVDPTKIIDQNEYSKFACTPTAVLNALQFGNEHLQNVFVSIPGENPNKKLRHIISTYGGLDSIVSAEQTLFGEERGMKGEDIVPFVNSILEKSAAKRMVGAFADRRDHESSQNQVARVHKNISDSLSAGVPIIASIRAFAALPTGPLWTQQWNGVGSHAIVIVGVAPIGNTSGSGFAFTFIDPDGAQLEEGYIFMETTRGFRAIKGSHETDYVWVGDRAFLNVCAPTLRLGTGQLPWNTRSFFTLHFIVGDFESSQ